MVAALLVMRFGLPSPIDVEWPRAQLIPLSTSATLGAAIHWVVELPPRSPTAQRWRLVAEGGTLAEGQLASQRSVQQLKLPWKSPDGAAALIVEGSNGAERIVAEAEVRILPPDQGWLLRWGAAAGAAAVGLGSLWQFWLKEFLANRERRDLVRRLLSNQILQAAEEVYVCKREATRPNLSVFESELSFLRVFFQPVFQCKIAKVQLLLDGWRDCSDAERVSKSRETAASLRAIAAEVLPAKSSAGPSSLAEVRTPAKS
ncbi:MAG: hypothetical protein JNK76_22145 [Planctomycetales bacterium]|nr:hypothetical protein [Planctomycetales bacterium]